MDRARDASNLGEFRHAAGLSSLAGRIRLRLSRQGLLAGTHDSAGYRRPRSIDPGQTRHRRRRDAPHSRRVAIGQPEPRRAFQPPGPSPWRPRRVPDAEWRRLLRGLHRAAEDRRHSHHGAAAASRQRTHAFRQFRRSESAVHPAAGRRFRFSRDGGGGALGGADGRTCFRRGRGVKRSDLPSRPARNKPKSPISRRSTASRSTPATSR